MNGLNFRVFQEGVVVAGGVLDADRVGEGPCAWVSSLPATATNSTLPRRRMPFGVHLAHESGADDCCFDLC